MPLPLTSVQKPLKCDQNPLLILILSSLHSKTARFRISGDLPVHVTHRQQCFSPFPSLMPLKPSNATLGNHVFIISNHYYHLSIRVVTSPATCSVICSLCSH